METDVDVRMRTDAELIAAARRSPEHFAVVFDRHYGRIYAYAARRLGRDLAEDVASETFLVAFSRLAGYDPARPDAGPWLYGIASNLIARHGRAESRRYRAMSKVPPERPAAEIDVAGRLDAATARGPAGGGAGPARRARSRRTAARRVGRPQPARGGDGARRSGRHCPVAVAPSAAGDAHGPGRGRRAMNEIDVLHDVFGPDELPSATAHDRARSALLDHINGPGPVAGGRAGRSASPRWSRPRRRSRWVSW